MCIPCFFRLHTWSTAASLWLCYGLSNFAALPTGNRDGLNHRDNPRCQQVERFMVSHIGHDDLIEALGGQVRETIDRSLRVESPVATIVGDMHEVDQGFFNLLVGTPQRPQVLAQDVQLGLPLVFY